MVDTLSRRRLRGKITWQTVSELLLREPEIVLTVSLVLLMSYLSPQFLTVHNLLNVLRQSSINGIVTCGVTWMLISGSFDLSVGSIVSLVSVTVVGMLEKGFGVGEVLMVGLAVGLATGIFNGLLIAWLKANPMIVTLGTQTIYQGFAFLVTGGLYYRVPRDSPFSVIGDGYVGMLAVPSIIFLCVALVMHIILSQTSFGLRIYAIGGNEKVAQLAGLKVMRHRIIMFIVTGLTSAIGAMVLSARAGSGSHQLGLGYEFNAITAAVLGGVYLFGGKGSIPRGVLGAILLALLANAMTLLGISVRMQLVVQGIILVIIVAIQVFASTRNS
jgi:ribose transport system permease protein